MIITFLCFEQKTKIVTMNLRIRRGGDHPCFFLIFFLGGVLLLILQTFL